MWIEKWNKDVEHAKGVEVIPLRRTAYLSVDIQIPDDGSFAEAELVDVEGRQVGAEGLKRPDSVYSAAHGSMRLHPANHYMDDREYGAYPLGPPQIREMNGTQTFGGAEVEGQRAQGIENEIHDTG